MLYQIITIVKRELFLLILFIILLPIASCSHYEPQDLYGAWKIDKILLDATDRTGGADYGYPWGTGIELKTNGSFRTNFARKEDAGGIWSMSTDGDQLFLHFTSAQKTGFKITLNQQHLVLKSLRWQVFLSKTDALPEPAKKEVNLANNLPGKWYFYEMNTKDSLIQYPRTSKQAHWVQIDWGGYYRSGEGKHESFNGRWLLQKDTLTFSEQDRVWKEQWKVRVEDNMLYFESLQNGQEDWYEVSLVHETRLVN